MIPPPPFPYTTNTTIYEKKKRASTYFLPLPLKKLQIYNKSMQTKLSNHKKNCIYTIATTIKIVQNTLLIL